MINRYESDESKVFYHGSAVELNASEMLKPGFESNYRSNIIMRHIYFTARLEGAGLAAQIACLLRGGKVPCVYEVRTTGEYEDDPNVTDKKFKGNPTLSYRSSYPLIIIKRVENFPLLSDEELKAWEVRLKDIKNSDKEIIN